MIEVAGTYNTAKLFTDTADNATIAQVTNLMNQPFADPFHPVVNRGDRTG